MKLNIAKIQPGENILEFSTEEAWILELTTRVSARGYEFLSPLSVNLRVTKLEPDYFMRGRLNCSVAQECARCAEVFAMPVDHPFETTFTQSINLKRKPRTLPPETEELDINFFEGHEIDLIPVIEEQFFLAIPFQSICSSDCRGICQKCGANKNSDPCDCKPGVKNPFATLREYQI